MLELKYRHYCNNYENIENYQKAAADNFVGWCIHHRYETHNSDGERRLVDITRKELIASGMYYNRPANELIFMTLAEHSSLHNKGKPKSEEHKKNLAAARKGKYLGENNSFYGKRHSEETKKKISQTKTGKKLGPFSEEHKQKLSETKKAEKNPNYGKHWYNNGEVNIMTNECPEGYVPGRLV